MLLLYIFRITGHSMLPTIRQGQTVLVSGVPFLFKNPKRGDIVVIKRDKQYIIKRINKNNGTKYFVKGDNKNDSEDSRYFGWIDKKEIIGKVIYRI